MRGTVLREVLTDNNLILSNVVRSLEISPQHLNNIFKSNDVKMSNILKIVKVTDIPLLDFLNKCENVHKYDKTFKNSYEIIKNNIAN